MRTMVCLGFGVAGSIMVASALAILGAAGSITLALLAVWALVGVYGRRAAMADSADVDAWRSDREGRRAAFDRMRRERRAGR
jgi:hypothetical protein